MGPIRRILHPEPPGQHRMAKRITILLGGARDGMKATIAGRVTGVALSLWAAASAQTPIDAEHLAEARSSFETAGAARLRCEMSSVKPALDFRLRFQTGYAIDFPLAQFRGSGHSLNVILRVTPEGGKPVYLGKSEALQGVPEADLKVEGELTGNFFVGEGAYAVDALVKDEAGRVCSAKWRIQARRTGGERDLIAPMPAGTVEADSPAGPRTAATRNGRQIERLTIFLHATPRSPRAAKLEPETARMLADSLATLLDQLPARSVRLVVFNMDQQTVLLRKEDFTAADLDQVTDAFDRLQLAVVNAKTLQNRDRLDVLSDLVVKELHAAKPSSAVIFLGPRTIAQIDPALDRDAHRIADTAWFYLQYLPVERRPVGMFGPGMNGRGPMSRRPEYPPNIDVAPLPPAQRMDGIEQLLRRLKQETLVVRTPSDLADAIRHVVPEIHMVDAAAGPAAPPSEEPKLPPAAPKANPPAVPETLKAPEQTIGDEDPVEVLASLRNRVLDHASQVPNHMCVETIRRDRYQPAGPPSKASCKNLLDARKQGNRPMHLEATDWLRLDVGLAEGREIYSWAGASRFEERELDELVPQGAIGTGAFATLLMSVFENPNPRYRFEGDTTLGARRLMEYSFAVPYEESRYQVKTRRKDWVITGYSGTLLVDPVTADLVRFIVRTDELPEETDSCEVDSILDYTRVPLGGFEYLLPKSTQQRFIGRDGEEAENAITFAACREYRGESTVSFGVNPATGPAQAQSGAPRLLPAGLPVSIEVAAPISFIAAAAGDRIVGRLARPLRDPRDQTVLAPEGAQVEGRNMRLELRQSGTPAFTVALRWETLEVDRSQLPLSLKPNRQISDLTLPAPGGLRRRGVQIELPQTGEETYGIYHFPARQEELGAGFRTEWQTIAP